MFVEKAFAAVLFSLDDWKTSSIQNCLCCTCQNHNMSVYIYYIIWHRYVSIV